MKKSATMAGSTRPEMFCFQKRNPHALPHDIKEKNIEKSILFILLSTAIRLLLPNIRP